LESETSVFVAVEEFYDAVALSFTCAEVPVIAQESDELVRLHEVA